MSCNEWKEANLGDFIALNYGKSLPKTKRVEGIYNVYGSSGITGTHNDYLVEGPGIIVGRKGTVGKVSYEEHNFFPIDTTYYITKSSEYNLKFMYYFLQTLSLDKMNSHSAVPGLNREEVYKLKVKIPNLQEQEKIANILSSLDDKIELNNEMNKTLEEMAQSIFKRWFVNFEFPNEDGEPYKSSGGEMVDSELGMIPKGWEVVKIEDITKIIRGASPRPIQEYIRDCGIPWIKISDATQSTSKYICNTNEFIKAEGKSKSRFIKSGTLILSNSATPGIPKITNLDSCVHDGWLIIDEFNYITKEFMYYFLLSQREEILNLSNGSVFRNLKTDILKKYKIILPNTNIIQKAQVVFEGIDRIIKNNVENNEVLQSLRDTLLPKLMSGEIRVK